MIDLHYWPTPNGKKVTILLEEAAIPYNIIPVNIGRGDQFTAEFLKMNPNHRMPVMVDTHPGRRRRADRRLRVRRDHDVPGREGRPLLSAGPARQIRRHRMADLADGQPGPQTRASAAISAASATSRAISPTPFAVSPMRPTACTAC